MFRTNVPVTAAAFHDRSEELRRLEALIDQLEEGKTSWVALLGARKIGKTSLLLELQQRRHRDRTVFAVLDSFEDRPVSAAIFRRLALRVTDAFVSRSLGASLESLAGQPDAYRAALTEVDSLYRAPRDLRAWLLSLPDARIDRAFVEEALKLPQKLAEVHDARCVVAWDEFQEVAQLSGTRMGGDLLALARATWQKHDRVAYLVSGSERTMLRNLVTSKNSPFFQHFSLIELGPMGDSDSLALLRHNAPPHRTIPLALARRAVSLLGGHPFYLQLFGETITAHEPPYDAAVLKDVFSELLFSNTGRLSMYFAREHDQIVGRASTLGATLQALCTGPRRLSDVASEIGAPTGATVGYIERLGDAVTRRKDGRYELSDPVFALWLQWRKPGGTIVPMSVVGEEAELEVARVLAAMGFELVYQSRASRGAFDLIAIRAGQPLGIQVKRTSLPLRFKKAEWNRMVADAARLGWKFVIAAVTPSAPSSVVLLDPAAARVGRTVVVEDKAAIDNLLMWVD
ncbi:MAG: ATP-binding protein [Deltaproteobacteria bacterium]|nr:ATP-binding protein [Deltaproteobacteria bacterium]